MDFKDLIENNKYIITEGSVVERIRRNSSLQLDEHLANSALIYSGDGREALTSIYKDYINIAQAADVPVIILTPTWRANKERIVKSGCSNLPVNEDNFKFLNDIRNQYGQFSSKIFIGGLIGCANDAYDPNAALSTKEAEDFHYWQLEKLYKAGVDFFLASTLPNALEAAGIAKAMSRFNIPYIISFIIRNNGALLDGMLLHNAIFHIDSETDPKPTYYMINCVHPSVLNEALKIESAFLPVLKNRLIGIQANTSAKSPEELDGITELQDEDPGIFAKSMCKLHMEYGLKILGGCCGTNENHIKAIVEKIA